MVKERMTHSNEELSTMGKRKIGRPRESWYDDVRKGVQWKVVRR